MTPLLGWGPAMMVALTVVLGVVYQTHHFDKRFEDLRNGVDKRFEDLREFIRSEIARIQGRIERLEHPVYRP
jgi:hypothetical protein